MKYAVNYIQFIFSLIIINNINCLKPRCIFKYHNGEIVCNDIDFNTIKSNYHPLKDEIREVRLKTPTRIFAAKQALFFKNTKVLNMRSNETIVLYQDSFTDLYFMESLIITSSNLKSIPKYLFKFSRLHLLDLSENTIKYLSKCHLEYLEQLKYLKLNNNFNIKLDDDSFSNLTSLKELYLSGINFSNYNLIKNLNDLLTLDLSFNDLRQLPVNFSRYFPELRQLNLIQTKLNNLTYDTFNGFSHLEHLYLGRNSISNLPCGIFNQLQNLKKLLLFEMNLEDLHCDLFRYNTKLRELSLYGNFLKTLGRSIFQYNTDLDILDLSNNHLHYLPSGVFSNLKELTTLNLGHNEFKFFDKSAFDLPRLKNLTLEANHLFYFPTDLLPKSLNYLNVQRNKLLFIDVNALHNVKKLEFCYNPLDCNCYGITIKHLNNNSINYDKELFQDSLCINSPVTDCHYSFGVLQNLEKTSYVGYANFKSLLGQEGLEKALLKDSLTNETLNVNKYFNIDSSTPKYYRNRFLSKHFSNI